MDHIAVRTCQSHEEAAIMRNALVEQGIPCELENDHQAGLTGVLAIRLLVPEDRLVEARKFLDEHGAE